MAGQRDRRRQQKHCHIAASLERMETGSITESKFNDSMTGGLNFVENKKCVLKVSEMCEIKPKEGKWIYVNYDLERVQLGEYLQPMLLTGETLD